MKIILALLLLDYSSGFSIIDARPGLLLVAPGDKVTLSCTVDDHYEWCKFYHSGGGECDFEWKRRQNNITMQMCDIANRVIFHGEYNDRECGITFTATEEDTGIWRCEVEEYILWRSRGAGRVETAWMNVTVQSPTTIPVSSSTVATTVSSSTVEPAVLSSTTVTAELSEDDNQTKPNKTTVDTLISSVENQIKIAETIEQNDDNGHASTVLISGIVLIILIVICMVFGAFYYRNIKEYQKYLGCCANPLAMRRKLSTTAVVVYDREAKLSSTAVVVYDREAKLSSTAVVVYDREAQMSNDQASLVRKDNIAFQPDSADTHSCHQNSHFNLTSADLAY